MNDNGKEKSSQEGEGQDGQEEGEKIDF